MATRKQKQDLIQALKFTPRDIEICLYGYGGEIVMGRVSEEVYDFWQNRDDLSDYAVAWDGEFEEEVPADARFIDCGAWHDVDDLCHENGVEASDYCSIIITDLLEGKVLFDTNLDLDNLDSKGVDTSNHSHCRPMEDQPSGTCVFMGQSGEKGTFFSGTIGITEPFDANKLAISWIDCDGWRLVSGVSYNGEDVEGYDGYSTMGKSMEFRVYQVQNDNTDLAAELAKIDVPILEGEEMWAQEAIDNTEPETWQGIPLTPWWPGDEPPARKGEYEVFDADSNWPFPQRAHWTGKAWKSGKESINVKSWRGLCEPAD